MSERAREMMVCIWPRKKRADEGLRAPGCASTASSAFFSCRHVWWWWWWCGLCVGVGFGGGGGPQTHQCQPVTRSQIHENG